MAEIVGTIITVASVIGIFQNCIQCFEQIKYGKRFGEDYENALLMLDTSRLRLIRWAKAVGLEETEALRAQFSDKEIKIMSRVLGSIFKAFEDARETSKVSADITELLEEPDAGATIPADQKLSTRMEKLHRNMKKLMEDRQKQASFTQKARWALYERTHSTELVQKVSSLTDMLDRTFPQAERKQMNYAREELKNIAHNAAEAKIVMQIAGQTDKFLEAAAQEAIFQYEGSEYTNIRVNASTAVLGNDIAFGVRTGGSTYSGLTIENGSVVRAGNVYRGQGYTPAPAGAAQFGIEGVFGAPPRRGTGANARRQNPDGPEVEEYDDGMDNNFLPQRQLMLDRMRTDSYLLKPPVNLEEALASRDLYVVQRFLARNFVSAAKGTYDWLHELDAAGYSKREIAELLVEDANDSPWIYFVPREVTRRELRSEHHISGCAHKATKDDSSPSQSRSQQMLFKSQGLDIRSKVEELCGIAGVVPTSRDSSTWYGNITFEMNNTVSRITYAAPSNARQPRDRRWTILSTILKNFSTAAAVVQSAGLCCNSFTALIRSRDHLELRRVEFRLVKEMDELLQIVMQNESDNAAIKNCTQQAEQILQQLREVSSANVDDNEFHTCSLAVQFVCVAFLSYIQAHVGPIKPFFLDTPQNELVLLGNHVLTEHSGINVRLVKLTCLAGMVRDRVLAFSPAAKFDTTLETADAVKCHVLTTAEDLLDTWGPGYSVHHGLDSRNLSAIAIGGGFIFPSDDNASMFHWTTERTFSTSLVTFQTSTKIMIGAIVSVNDNCDVDRDASRNSSACALENLGTYGSFWYPNQRQVGIQGGQYLNATFNQTWEKMPGKTLKDQTFEQPHKDVVYLLDQNWGLQVSFCTSVARRVPLRQLIADLLPEFVNPVDQNTWQKLTAVHNIIDVFTHHDINSWLSGLSDSLKSEVIAMVYQVLWQLRHTGFDRQNGTLKVAWPHNGDLRGLRIPCATHTCWAPILADAEDCATFAYVTTKCLETRFVKCQGVDRVWQNISKMLVTEMSQHRSEGYSVTSTTTSRWQLRNGEWYYVTKSDSLIWVKVERTADTGNDTPQLLIEKSKMPQRLWARFTMKEEKKRNRCIREKQAAGDYAENVLVRSSLLSA